MSTNAAPTPVPAAPAAPAVEAAPATQAAPSADEVLSDLAARRLALAADVDELAARLAPNNLAKVAKLKAREKVQGLRSQAVSKAEEKVGQVKNRLVSLAGGGTDPEGGVDSYEPGTLTLGQPVCSTTPATATPPPWGSSRLRVSPWRA